MAHINERWLMFLPLLLISVADAVLDDRPVIGVIDEHFNHTHTYIAASYVKFAESAGARVVPLHMDWPERKMKSMFQNINGVIFPGGGNGFHGNFFELGRTYFNLALHANDQGDPFPIHGTCLGYELLSVLAANSTDILCHRCFKTEGTPLALNFTKAASSSKLFSDMPRTLMEALATKNLTENSHKSGVTLETFRGNKKLSRFFSLLSTSRLGDGRTFVSTIEAKRYPFTGTQWHPEKANFEWAKFGPFGYKAIPHSAEAVKVSQYMANNFVARARQSSHRFSTRAALESALIDNTVQIKDPHGYFSGIYLWSRDKNAKWGVGN